MENELARACAETNRLTGEPGARLHHGQVASPAAFRLSGKRKMPPEKVAEQLAAELTLDGRYFSAVTPERGYLNFTLSDAWYRRVEDAALLIVSPERIVQDRKTDSGFPAAICPFDQQFLAALGESAAPERAARQDRENPGWLVRYTAARLARFGSAAAPVCCPPEGKAVLLAVAQLPKENVPAKETARALLQLAGQVWAATPQKLPPRTAEAARLALWAGISAFG